MCLKADQSLSKDKEVVKNKDDTDQDNSSQRAWIMQYMEERSCSEEVSKEWTFYVHS